MQKWIIHVDMDAFFAAVEQRDNPELQSKPVIIGGLSGRGVVSTASYEARKYGVRSAMPMVEARRRCPQGIFLTGNYDKYIAVSREIMNILADFSPFIEPLSLDEAFLDMTGTEWLFPDLVETARQIKARIKAEVGIVASAGIAPNKFLAKLASDLDKPDGLLIIRPGEEQLAIAKLPVSRLWGVGKTTADSLQKLGINTIGQLAETDLKLLKKYCGNFAEDLQRLACGIDDRPVIAQHEPKSIGKETTFEHDLVSVAQVEEELLLLAEKVGWRLRRYCYSARTITVKIRFASFRTITRSKTLTDPTNFDELIFTTAQAIWSHITMNEGIRLVGITATNLQAGCGQMSLFSEETDKRQSMYQAVDKLKAKFGEKIITKGRLVSRDD
ncbi:DNA polymerase IV 1 [bioreactor metagenome]|uniref:DNA-directed DNA polymerase n=1 Tax=bioreactor metagenome TaxID=1076179 RepID=A0A644TQT0_9ZZZZ|nr:DNA polymerase IV [Negativicutes bacterium]